MCLSGKYVVFEGPILSGSESEGGTPVCPPYDSISCPTCNELYTCPFCLDNSSLSQGYHYTRGL